MLETPCYHDNENTPITAYLTWISRGGPTSTFISLVSGDVAPLCSGMADVESYMKKFMHTLIVYNFSYSKHV